MRKLSILLLFAGIFLAIPAMAQQRTISGAVLSRVAEQPLPNVTVSVPGTNVATTTNEKGEFSLQVPVGKKTLVFTSVGYQNQTIELGNQLSLTIYLEASFESLDKVVVVGYGTQKKEDLTGAVTTVDVEEVLSSRPITDLARGLQGVVPGLTITTPNGDIGTNPEIHLRGMTGSLNAPGGAQPLILVDNVEYNDLRLLNPNDIESITVLKDAASTSIYGTRAAWGVILITTKRGKIGGDKSSITYTNNFSFRKPTTRPTIADAADGAEMAFKAYNRRLPSLTQFGVVGMYFDEIGIQKMRDWEDTYGGQDLGPEMVEGRDYEIRDGKLFFYRSWDADEMFLRKTTPQQIHNLSFSGSGSKTAFNLNLGYLNESGVLKTNPDKFDRYNVDLGMVSNVKSWLTVRGKVMLAKGLKTRPFYFSSETYDPWYYLYRWPKTYPYGTVDGKPFRSAVTEISQAKLNTYESNMTRISVGGTFKIIKGLTLDADYTFTGNNDHEHQTGGSVTGYNFWAGGGKLNYGAYTSSSYDRAIYESYWDNLHTVKAYATYNKQIKNEHDLKLIVGTDVELFEYWSQYSQRRDLLHPDFGEPSLATGDQFADNNRGHWATNGYFGRINYAFRGRYLIEVNGRFDGSSQFPKNDHWGFFPSASAGYILTKESYMDFAKPILTFLKLRGSYGSVGNENLGRNRFLKIMRASSSGWFIGGENQLTMTTPGLVSPSLTWENVSTLDFGVDARFFSNRFGVTFDWYQRKNSDMLTGVLTVPNTLGTGAPVLNFGELTTTGWELALDYNHVFENGLNIGIVATLADFREELTKFANESKLLGEDYTGKDLGAIWGYETDRLFQKDDFQQDANGELILINGVPVLKEGIPTQSYWEASWFHYGPGDVKYKDLNGDGEIDFGANSLDDHGDLAVIGNTTPRYQYGFRLNAAYKGIDLSMYIQGVGKRNMWPNGPIVIPGYRPGEAWYQHQLDYWSEENTNAYYPRPTDASQSNNTRNFLPQTRYLLNMAYTRLKNITAGYTLPVSLTEKVGIVNARIYLSGENLFEIEKLNVPLDPEIDYTTPGLNDPNTFGRVYPYMRSYSFGLQVTF